MADSWWMNFSSIRSISPKVQDIYKDGEFSKWLLSSLDQKSFQELLFKAVKNRKHNDYVDCQQVRQIDQNLFFSKLKR